MYQRRSKVGLPSGNLTVCYWKWSLIVDFHRSSHEQLWFSTAILVIARRRLLVRPSNFSRSGRRVPNVILKWETQGKSFFLNNFPKLLLHIETYFEDLRSTCWFIIGFTTQAMASELGTRTPQFVEIFQRRSSFLRWIQNPKGGRYTHEEKWETRKKGRDI